MDTWHLLGSAVWPIVSGALVGTIPLTAASFAIGLTLALVIALMRMSRVQAVSWLARSYISVIRGTPLIVQLFIIFYGLPQLGVTIDPFPSAIVAFSLNVAGYAAESIRGAILAVPKGQWEAAETVGLNFVQSLRRVILPQALRVAVPSLSNTFISLVKDTSLASTIMVTELFRQAQVIAAPSYRFLELYVLAAAIYWIICLGLSAGQLRLESHLARAVAR